MKFYYKHLLVGMAIFAFAAQAHAQQLRVTGTVTDSLGVLSGVNVTVKNKPRGTITNFDGEYVLDVKPNDTLVFSYMGYNKVTTPLNGRTSIDIQLQKNANALKEVVINAGYYNTTKRESTGSISRITAEEIEKQPVTNVLATMQGRMAGVQITQNSGVPGGGFQIRIRGLNSLRADGNQPLYIVDGVPFSSETIGAVSTSGNMPELTSPLNSLNPADIQSIEVLKDADATAIYGSRGANGVVLITTKKGRPGKTRFTLSTTTGIAQVTRTPDLMKTGQYLAMRRKAFADDGVNEYPVNAYDINGIWDKNRYTDWQEEFIGGTAEITSLRASVSGGNQETQFLLSGNTRTETTVFPGNFKYRKSAAHFGMNHTNDDERFKLSFSANYTVQKNNQPATDLTRVARMLAPNAPKLYDGEGNLNWENSTWTNPLAGLESEFLSKINSFLANTVLSYNFLPNLQFKTSLGYSDLRNKETRTMPSTMYDPAYGLGSESSALASNRTSRTSWIAEPQLNWSYNFGKNEIKALLGSTFQNQVTNRLFQSGGDFSSNSLINDLASASIKIIDRSDETVYKYQAFFARINYNHDSRYIVNITGRRDGSSRFGPGKQFANFGAVGAAWLFSNENFWKGEVLSFGKLRASYGITGNDQIGDYQFLDTYLSSGNTYQGIIGMQPVRLFNNEFGWEINKKFEVALETGFFKNRILLTTAYYRNRSSNQLVGIPLPGTTGFTTLNANLDATVQNTGLEVTLNTENYSSPNFSWTSNFNISFNRNKLIAYPGLETSSYANTYVVGQPLNISKRYHYTGINEETGIYEFEDMNGDGEITSAKDRGVVADLSPKYFGGFQNHFRYKKVQLNFLFQFVKQKRMAYMPGVPGLAINQLAAANIPAQLFTAGGNGEVTSAYYRFKQSDGAVKDASYIRLKNVSITYELPLPWKGMSGNLILQGRNLLLFTPYEGGDPEFKFMGHLPPLRVVSAGINLTF